MTAAGSVTLSATVSPEDFERLFGQPFAGHGFAADLASAAALPVPAALRAGIESISTTPRLQTMER